MRAEAFFAPHKVWEPGSIVEAVKQCRLLKAGLPSLRFYRPDIPGSLNLPNCMLGFLRSPLPYPDIQPLNQTQSRVRQARKGILSLRQAPVRKPNETRTACPQFWHARAHQASR